MVVTLDTIKLVSTHSLPHSFDLDVYNLSYRLSITYHHLSSPIITYHHLSSPITYHLSPITYRHLSWAHHNNHGHCTSLHTACFCHDPRPMAFCFLRTANLQDDAGDHTRPGQQGSKGREQGKTRTNTTPCCIQ
ncbi:hypothetical protein K504DRAFT_460497 [Pleomassaria siparia CBS 279.74]|uniref:Uncharacterized protein n=1 Tax=Pleomassaria siparia CBS 279.74 TaxID=1314801 RepID=A0A6G1JY90_9PLEO|nr:hypothetical protein K504DRAFT_460497 [Pleomassaria siparia CBS 279.74]